MSRCVGRRSRSGDAAGGNGRRVGVAGSEKTAELCCAPLTSEVGACNDVTPELTAFHPVP